MDIKMPIVSIYIYIFLESCFKGQIGKYLGLIYLPPVWITGNLENGNLTQVARFFENKTGFLKAFAIPKNFPLVLVDIIIGGR